MTIVNHEYLAAAVNDPKLSSSLPPPSFPSLPLHIFPFSPLPPFYLPTPISFSASLHYLSLNLLLSPKPLLAFSFPTSIRGSPVLYFHPSRPLDSPPIPTPPPCRSQVSRRPLSLPARHTPSGSRSWQNFGKASRFLNVTTALWSFVFVNGRRFESYVFAVYGCSFDSLRGRPPAWLTEEDRPYATGTKSYQSTLERQRGSTYRGVLKFGISDRETFLLLSFFSFCLSFVHIVCLLRPLSERVISTEKSVCFFKTCFKKEQISPLWISCLQ